MSTVMKGKRFAVKHFPHRESSSWANQAAVRKPAREPLVVIRTLQPYGPPGRMLNGGAVWE